MVNKEDFKKLLEIADDLQEMSKRQEEKEIGERLTRIYHLVDYVIDKIFYEQANNNL